MFVSNPLNRYMLLQVEYFYAKIIVVSIIIDDETEKWASPTFLRNRHNE